MSEPLHHAGVWWARTVDGAVLRFNEELDGWEAWTPHTPGPPPPSQWRELIAQPAQPATTLSEAPAPPPPPEPDHPDRDIWGPEPGGSETAVPEDQSTSNVSPLRKEQSVHQVRADLLAETISRPGTGHENEAPAARHNKDPEEPVLEPQGERRKHRSMKPCLACGEEVNEQARICPFCDFDFVAGTRPRGSGFAVAGFVFGVVGFLLPLFGAIFALTFGYIARGQAENEAFPKRYRVRLAGTAIILGWAQLALWALAVSAWRYL